MPGPGQTVPPSEALTFSELLDLPPQGIASRVLARTGGGNLTLFAMDAGQAIEEHTSPFDAFVVVLQGRLALTIGGRGVEATPDTVVRMPGGVPHGLEAREATRLLLVMLREPKG